MQVSHIMQKDIFSVLPTDSVQKAAQKMKESRSGMLLVLEKGSVKGIVTEKEITSAMGRVSEQPTSISAADDDGNRCCYFNDVQEELLSR